MRLSPDDLVQFTRIQTSVWLYANAQLQVLPGVRSATALEDSDREDQVRLRDALYDRPELIEDFVAAKRGNLHADDLAIVAGWKHFVRGDFYVVRFLKRYAVLLTADAPPRAYGVVGLHRELEEVLPPMPLPIVIRSVVLLPFKGRIVYDGFARTFDIYFGSGLRSSLNEEYQALRERGEIHESLGPAAAAATPRSQARRAAKPRHSAEDQLAILDRMAADAEGLRGADSPATQRAFVLLRAAIGLARGAVATPTDVPQWNSHFRRTRAALAALHTSLSRTVWRDG